MQQLLVRTLCNAVAELGDIRCKGRDQTVAENFVVSAKKESRDRYQGCRLMLRSQKELTLESLA